MPLERVIRALVIEPFSLASIKTTTLRVSPCKSRLVYDGFGERLHCTPEPPMDTDLVAGTAGAGGATGAGCTTGCGAGFTTLVSETVVVTVGVGCGVGSTGLTTGFGASAFFTCWTFSTFFGGGGNGFSTTFTSLTSGGLGCAGFGSAFGCGGKGFGGS